jgi:hypothetical protein
MCAGKRLIWEVAEGLSSICLPVTSFTHLRHSPQHMTNTSFVFKNFLDLKIRVFNLLLGESTDGPLMDKEG